MASGKARGIKRSSATSSYSSATTIVIFVGLSVLGLWLLTSNSFAPPQSSTTKTPTRIASTGHTHHSNELPQTHHNQDDPSYISDPSKGERPNDDKADETVEIETETKIENEEIQTDGGVKTEATLPDQVDHQDTKGSQENNVAEEQEKQAALETQTSEESSMTQKQHAEEITEENPHSETKVETNDPESSGNHGVEVITTEGGSLTQSSETTQNQITDEDQQRRIDEHQQQEDEQNQQRQQEAQSKDPNGATSHDQIQHDEASLHSHQTGSSSQETDEPNAHAENQETKHDSLGEDRNKASLSQKMNEEKTNNGDEASTSNGDNSEIPKESTESKKSWSTQANQSENQKERRKTGSNDQESSNHGYTWLLCNVTADADYIPCLDNEKVIANIHKRTHHEHRERHCPEDPPTCLVPLILHGENTPA